MYGLTCDIYDGPTDIKVQEFLYRPILNFVLFDPHYSVTYEAKETSIHFDVHGGKWH